MCTTTPAWTDAARRRLLALRHRDGGWGYQPESASAVEPSALAGLALLGTGPADDDDQAGALGAAWWVADRCRRPDGSTGLTARAEASSPGWTTPFALLLWNALGGFGMQRRSAVNWLLSLKGKGDRPVPNNPMGHDVTLIGWPWVADTHSWVEPTATAMLALAPSVSAGNSRIREGVRVLLDRAISTGGWNLGNPVVFGQTFRSLPGPTGLALLALARVARTHCPPPMIARAVGYLRMVVDQTAAPTSLGWAILGLRAWDAGSDPAVAARLAAAADRVLARNPTAIELAMLLLAAGDDSLAILGVSPALELEMAR